MLNRLSYPASPSAPGREHLKPCFTAQLKGSEMTDETQEMCPRESVNATQISSPHQGRVFPGSVLPQPWGPKEALTPLARVKMWSSGNWEIWPVGPSRGRSGRLPSHDARTSGFWDTALSPARPREGAGRSQGLWELGQGWGGRALGGSCDFH